MSAATPCACSACPPAKRSPVLPDGPTISESAVPGFEASVWFALFAPAGTPQAVVDLLNSKVNAALARGRGEGKLPEGRQRAGRRRTGCSRRQGAGGVAEVDGDRAREEHPHRAVTSRRLPSWLIASARCISASSCSAPATIRPDGAIEGAYSEQLQPAGDADHRAHRRARQIRPVLHLRRVGDGPRRPSVVRQPVRAAHPARRR